MDMLRTGSAAAAAGFEVPLEMLAACHGRVQQQCDLLSRLVPHLREQGSDTQARDAAQRLLRYFDTAAKHHHADEEEDLFPALLEAMAGSDAVCIRGMIGRLQSEHRGLEQRWARLREPLQAIQDGQPGLLEAREVQDFIDDYTRHIDYEEAEVLPMAARLLCDEQLDAIGRAMRLRRGVELPPDAA